MRQALLSLCVISCTPACKSQPPAPVERPASAAESAPAVALAPPFAGTPRHTTITADFDGDGRDDWVARGHEGPAGEHTNSVLYVFAGIEKGIARPVTLESPDRAGLPGASRHQGIYSFAEEIGRVGDVTGDGFADLLVSAGYAHAPDRLLFYAGTAEGLREVPSAQIVGPQKSVDPHWPGPIVGLGDVDGDGFGDFAVGAELYFGHHDGPVRPPTVLLDLWAPKDKRNTFARVHSLRSEGEEAPELLVESIVPGRRRRFHRLRWSEAEQRLSVDRLKLPELSGGLYAVGDVDGDGDADLLVSATEAAGDEAACAHAVVRPYLRRDGRLVAGTPARLLLDGCGEERAPAPVRPGLLQPDAPLSVASVGPGAAVADVNGDGRGDLLVPVATRGRPYQGAMPAGTYPDIPVGYELRLHLGTERGLSADDAGRFPARHEGSLTASGLDLDGDGRDEVVVRETSWRVGHAIRVLDLPASPPAVAPSEMPLAPPPGCRAKEFADSVLP